MKCGKRQYPLLEQQKKKYWHHRPHLSSLAVSVTERDYMI